MADWFLVGDNFGYLSDVVAEWLAYGVGLGAIFWLIGQVVSFVIRFLRY